DIMKISANVKRDIVFAARLRKKIGEREERGEEGASLVFSSDNTLRVLQNYYDISLAHYILQPEMRHGITELASQYLNYQLPVGVTSTKRGGAKEEDPETAAELAWLTLRLCAPLKELLENESEEMRKLLYDVEFPLIEVLAEMELTGVRIDVAALNEAAKAMESRIAGLEKEIFELAGEEFNVGSPAKVGEILFDKLQLDPKAKKTKTGQYSTSEDILEKLIPKNPIVEKILKFRQLRKLLNTYLTALPANINPETGKVHTNYNQTVTATGRISSSAPNLQNIPVRDDEGREIRRAFIADPGHIFLSADYSQIELRLVADFADDEIMLDAFRHGKDIHAITAAKIYHKNQEDVTDNERRNAKTANFGILYGISAFGLASRLGIPRGEAKELIDNYFVTFPTIHKYMSDSVEMAREHGYVTTRMGRKRILPDINSRNPVVRGYAERNAINAPVQGSAADIIKVAMVDIWREMREKGMKSKMIMQVHDELNFDVVPEELPAMQELVERLMANAYHGRVNLTASCGAATNWLDAH
ncbi:MAG: DNA polymerase I, partial [Muribaculaceae bacterium]|nr:DNA polymerase I [Muribaculaceae bacterium]